MNDIARKAIEHIVKQEQASKDNSTDNMKLPSAEDRFQAGLVRAKQRLKARGVNPPIPQSTSTAPKLSQEMGAMGKEPLNAQSTLPITQRLPQMSSTISETTLLPSLSVPNGTGFLGTLQDGGVGVGKALNNTIGFGLWGLDSISKGYKNILDTTSLGDSSNIGTEENEHLVSKLVEQLTSYNTNKTNEWLRQYNTEAYHEAERELYDKVSQSSGFVDSVKATWDTVSSNPNLLAGMTTEQLGNIAVGGAYVKGANKLLGAGKTSTALGEGLASASFVAKEYEDETGNSIELKDLPTLGAVAGSNAILSRLGMGRGNGNNNLEAVVAGASKGKPTVTGILADIGSESLQEGVENIGGTKLKGEKINPNELGRDMTLGAMLTGTLQSPRLAVGTASSTLDTAGKSIDKVTQTFTVKHEDLINPKSKHFDPTEAFKLAHQNLVNAQDDESRQTARQQLQEVHQAVENKILELGDKINNAQSEEERAKYHDTQHLYIKNQLMPIQNFLDSLAKFDNENGYVDDIITSVVVPSKVVKTDTTTTDTDTPQENQKPIKTPKQSNKPSNVYTHDKQVKINPKVGMQVGIMGNYMAGGKKGSQTGAGSGDHFDITVVSGGKGKNSNPSEYFDRFMTADGNVLHTKHVTAGQSYGANRAYRNGTHYGIDIDSRYGRELYINPKYQIVNMSFGKDVKSNGKGGYNGYGNYAIITFSDGLAMRIAHMDDAGMAQLKKLYENSSNSNTANININATWQGKNHRTLKNNTQYDQKLSAIYSQYGFTPAEQQILKAQIAQESGFNPNAVSNVGAFGLTQFMPATAKQYGVKQGDIDSMIHGQAKYMQANLKKHKGDWAKALAEYNTGDKDGRVSNDKRFRNLTMTNRWAKGQTLHYVENILANAKHMSINGQPVHTENSSTVSANNQQEDLVAKRDKLLEQLNILDDTANTNDNAEQVKELQEQLTAIQEQLKSIQNNNLVADDKSNKEESIQKSSQLDEQIINEIRQKEYSKLASTLLATDVEDTAYYSKSLNQIKQLEKAGVLTSQEASGFRQLLDIKVKIKGNNADEVSAHIYKGKKGNNSLESNLGLEDYYTQLSTGLYAKNTSKTMEYLTRFRDDHVSKANALLKAVDMHDGVNPITIAYSNKSNSWEITDADLPSTARKFEVRSNHITPIIQRIINEAKDIDEFTTAWQNILAQQDNPIPTPTQELQVRTNSVKNNPAPIDSSNSSIFKQTHSSEKMNDANGAWIGRSSDNKSMSYLNNPNNQVTESYVGMFGNPYNTKNPNNSWYVPDEQTGINQYRSLLAKQYIKHDFFRDAFEDLRGRNLHSVNGANGIESKVISQLLDATAQMSDEDKLAYMRELATPQMKEAKKRKALQKLDREYKHKYATDNQSVQEQQSQSENNETAKQSEPIQVDEYLYDGQELPISLYNEVDEEATMQAYHEYASSDEIIEQETTIQPEPKSELEPTKSKQSKDEVKENKPKTHKSTKQAILDDGISVTPEKLKTGDEIKQGKQLMVNIIHQIDFDDDSRAIVSGILKRYPNLSISFDGSNADIKVKGSDTPRAITIAITKYATSQLIGLVQTTDDFNDDVVDKDIKQLKDNLDAIQNQLKHHAFQKDISKKDKLMIETLLESYESTIINGIQAKSLLTRIESQGKVKSNLFTTLINGIKAFFNIPNKTSVENLYERLLDTVAKTIEIQAKDSYKDGKLSVLASNKEERDAEASKIIYEQNVLKAGIIQNGQENIIQVKDLASRIRMYGLNELTRLGLSKPNQQQQAQLEHFLAFQTQFTEALEMAFRKKGEKYKFEDQKQFFNIGTDTTPKFDENLMTAISHAVYDMVVSNGVSEQLSKRELRKLLSTDSDAVIPNHIAKKYRYIGKSLNEVTASLGSTVIRDLRLKQTDNVPAETLARLEASVGDWIIAGLQIADMVHINHVPSKEFNEDKAVVNGVSTKEYGEVSENAITSFVKISTNKTNKEIVDVSKSTGSYLSTVLGVQSGKRLPSLKPSQDTVKTIKGTHANISTKQANLILKAQQEPMKINTKFHGLVNRLKEQDETYLYDLFGARVPEDSELIDVHVSKHESIKESAEGKKRELDNYFDFVGTLPDTDTAFYDTIDVKVNSRMHYNSNVVNFQSSLIHRSLVEYENFKHEIDLSNWDKKIWFDDKGKPTDITLFLRAIFENAEGTKGIFKEQLKELGMSDYTVDKVPSEIFIPIAMDYLLHNEELKSGVDAIRKLASNKPLEELDKQNIKRIVDTWDMGSQSLRALMEVATFLDTLESKGKFTTSLGISSDGVNNGTAIGMVLMGVFQPEVLHRLGIFDGVFKNYYDTRYNSQVADYYSAFEDYLRDAIDKDIEELESGKDTEKLAKLAVIQKLNTNLFERKMLKAILIPFGYGAGNIRLVQSAFEQFEKDVYAQMEKIAKLQETNPADFNALGLSLQKDLQALLGDKFTLPTNLLEFTFNDSQRSQLQTVYSDLLGKSIQNAIKNYASEFSDRRTFNIAIHESTYTAYEMLKNKLEAEAEQKRIEYVKAKYPNVKTQQLNRVLAYETLTPAQRKEWITDELNKAFPSIKTNYEIDELSGSIELVEEKKTFVNDNAVETSTYQYDNTKKGLVNRYKNPLIRMKNILSAGVRPNSQMIQSMDSGISAEAMTADDVISINIHDANIGGNKHYNTMVQAQNKAFFGLTAKYHLYTESFATFVNTINQLDKFTQQEQEELVAEWIGNFHKTAMLSEDMMNIIQSKGDLNSQVNELITILAEQVETLDSAKINLLLNQKSIHQYAGEGGEYYLTNDDYKMLNAELEKIKSKNAELKKSALKAVQIYQGKLGAVKGVHYNKAPKKLIEKFHFDATGVTIDRLKEDSELHRSIYYALVSLDKALVDYNSKKMDSAKELAEWVLRNPPKPTKYAIPDKQYKPNELANFSGGAYGADSIWDNIGHIYGVHHHTHYRAKGNTKLAKGIVSKATVLSDEELDFARSRVNDLLGLNLTNSIIDNLKARNYYQVVNADGVFAIAELTDMYSVKGDTNVAVQLGIAMGKPVYVWDTETESWYQFNPDILRFEKTDTPKLTQKFAGVGTRDIQHYGHNEAKYLGKETQQRAEEAIRTVYANTFNASNKHYGKSSLTNFKVNDEVTHHKENGTSDKRKSKQSIPTNNQQVTKLSKLVNTLAVSDESVKALYESLQGALGKDMDIVFTDEVGFKGRYHNGTLSINTSEWNKLTDLDKLILLNHELSHALTVNGLTNKGSQAVKDLTNMYRYLKSVYENSTDIMSDEDRAVFDEIFNPTELDGITPRKDQEKIGIAELVAYGLSNATVVNFIANNLDLKKAGVKAKTKVSILDRFYQAIQSILKIKKPYKAFLANVNEVIELNKTVTSDTAYYSKVNRMPVQDVFKTLNTDVSDEHNARLDSLIDVFIGALYGSTNHKALVNLSQGKLKNTSLVNGLKSSDKEAYVTEAMAEVFKTLLDNHSGTLAYNGLNKLYQQAQKEFATAQDLFPEYEASSKDEQARLRAIHQFAFNAKNGKDKLAWFMALAVSNETLANQLSQVTIKNKRDTTTWFDKIMGMLESVINVFNNVFFQSKGNDAKSKIDAYVQALANIETKARNQQVDYIQNGYELFHGGMRKFIDKPLTRLATKSLDSEKLIQSNNSTIRVLGKLASVLNDELDLNKGELNGTAVEDLVTRVQGATNTTRYKVLSETINEVMGLGKRGLNADAMVRLTQKIAQHRQMVKDNTKKGINRLFKSKLDKPTKKAVTSTLLHTDLASLLNHGFKPNQVLEMLDDTKRKATIEKYENQLIDLLGKEVAYDMLHQVYSLGKYMATGNTSANLIKSAEGIAIGLGSEYQTSFDKMDNKVFELVDVLSSLIALELTHKSQIKSLKNLLVSETEGLIALLNIHQQIIQKGKSDFKYNPYNYQKGYLPQITNPYRKVIRVSADDVDKYSAKGFEVVSTLTQDIADKTNENILMVHTDYQTGNFISGALDMVDTHHRGTTIYEQGIHDKEISHVIKTHLAIRKAKAKTRPTLTTIDNTGGALVPTYDTTGAILDYHYEMSHSTRDILLERNNDFDELLGILNGALEFKPEMSQHQKEIAKVLYQDAKEHYAKRPYEYIDLDFNSTDPEIRRVVRMLPYPFRAEMIKLYGSSNRTFPIHKSLFTATFGYQAYSVVNIWDKVDNQAKLNIAERSLYTLMDLFFGKDSRKQALQIERVIQDLMATIKDFIVIRSGGVLLGNILSNSYLLMSLGINPIRVLKDSTFAWRNVKQYRNQANRIEEINVLLMSTKSSQEKSKLMREKTQLEQSLNRNPLKEYMEAGLMSTIVEDLGSSEDTAYKTNLQKKIDSYVDLIPKPIQTGFNEIAVGKSSKLHNLLSEATQFSDFSAKYTLAKYHMEKGMNKEKAIYEAQMSFINYDIPTNQFLDYMNRVGFMMFTKFFLRFQRVMTKLAINAPVSSVMGHYAVEYAGGQGVYDPFVLNRLGNPLDGSLLLLPDAVGSVITNPF